MPKKWLADLHQAMEANQLVEVDCAPILDDAVTGYVVGATEAFILIHELDPAMYLDGYVAVYAPHVKRHRIVDDWDAFATRALQLRGIAPKMLPTISLSDFPSLLTTIQERFPLVVLTRRMKGEELCCIGKVLKLSRRTVTLREIDPGAEWEVTRRHRFQDILRIDFGGGYANALWEVHSATHRKKGSKRSRSKAYKGTG